MDEETKDDIDPAEFFARPDVQDFIRAKQDAAAELVAAKTQERDAALAALAQYDEAEAAEQRQRQAEQHQLRVEQRRQAAEEERQRLAAIAAGLFRGRT